MHWSWARFLAILLGVWSFAAAPALAQDNEKPTFKAVAESLVGGCALQLVEYWHCPHLTSWAKVKMTNAPEDWQERIRTFSEDLLAALRQRESADHEMALRFVVNYASLARAHAAHLAERDLSLAVARALAPHTQEIKASLVTALQAKAAGTRLRAALALLALDESHAGANAALRASVTCNAEILAEGCHLLGLAQLASRQAIDFLGRMLAHQDATVRESAAGAAITMAPRDLAPALIAYLETGPGANGSYTYPFALALPQHGNLALLALEALQEHCRLAIPVILKRFAESGDDDQIAMLACIAGSGCKDEACLTLVRKALQSENLFLKLIAACTMLHLVPGDRAATDLLRHALTDGTTRQLALEVCQRLGPPSREVVSSLLPMLEHSKEDVRINATRALARIGRSAAAAIPRIEKLLAREEDARTHTYRSTQAAAYALWKIGGKEAAAALLCVAATKTGGALYALRYLPGLVDDLPPHALQVMVRALQGDDDRLQLEAVIALSNLGERAHPVRADLLALRDDPDLGPFVDTALRRIPAKQ